MIDPQELVPVVLRAGQWAAVLAAAANYEVRIPRDQGDGGECLEIIAAAIDTDVPAIR